MTPFDFLINLAETISVFMALTFTYGLALSVTRGRPAVFQSVFQGMVFGLFGMLTMLKAAEPVPGLLFEAGTIIAAAAGIMGGWIPAAIAGALVALCRLFLGGSGALAGVLTICLAGGLGYGLHVYHRRQGTPAGWRTLALLGMGTAALRLLIGTMLAGPALPAVTFGLTAVLMPAGTLLFGLMLLYQKRHDEVEAAQRASEERYRSLVAAMSEGMILQDEKGVITTCNRSAEQILGYPASHLIGHTSIAVGWSAIDVNGSPIPVQHHPSSVTLLTGEPQFNVMMGVYRPDQSLVWLLVNSHPLFSDDRLKPCAVVTTFTDVTEHKAAQESLQRERQLLRTVIDSTPDYIFVKDAQGRYILSNEAHAQAAHVEADALIGLTAFDVFPAELAAQFHDDDLRVIRSGQALLDLERTTIDAAGHEKTVLTSKVPLRHNDGSVAGVIGISREITDRRLLEERTAELADERERVQALRRFIASMVHDLRISLTALNNNFDLLRRTTNPERQPAHAAKLEAQIMRMAHLLDELAEMERSDRDATPPLNPTDLNPLVYDVIRLLMSRSTARGQRLDFALDAGVPPVMADEQQLRQAVEDLVESAILSTPAEGVITVSTTSSNQWVYVQVEGTGAEIAPDDLLHSFEPFYRANSSPSSKTAGWEMGLATTKEIIETHQGSIHIDSRPGQGSIFTVALPAVDYIRVLEHLAG
ncbi:MAG TPA: PAS domain-containing protein [Spirillospora sp.]|nr:PAS domain-containing protein [Spirillospora sp.]